jgi:hypothetical protein
LVFFAVDTFLFTVGIVFVFGIITWFTILLLIKDLAVAILLLTVLVHLLIIVVFLLLLLLFRFLFVDGSFGPSMLRGWNICTLSRVVKLVKSSLFE